MRPTSTPIAERSSSCCDTSTRSEAVQIAKDLGLHGVDLKSNPCPPRKDDLAALLASGQPLIWRDFVEDSQWQPRITLPHIK